MNDIVITGTGLFTPNTNISNEELVLAFNQYVANYNKQHEAAIAAGDLSALNESNVAFIEKASGIKNRYVLDKTGVLDPGIMQPLLAERANGELSIQAEMAVAAARQALQQANKKPEEIDLVIVACSNMQRAYPAMAIEVQAALGCAGYAFDLNVACSSATFGLQTGVNALIAKQAKVVLIVNPEICSAHLNFRDRDSHFIFGDACTAVILETTDTCQTQPAFAIIDTYLKTQFSNNIRNNFGFLNRTSPATVNISDKLFVQNGRQVFKEVVPWVAKLITQHLHDQHIEPVQVKRFWLHQANLNMNQLIAEKILGRAATEIEAPVILDRYANTSSAGSVIAFHLYHKDLEIGDIGVLCSFGAGYSVGNVILKRLF